MKVTAEGKLEIFINGESEGYAVQHVPLEKDIWAVVDMYGTCQQISVIDVADDEPNIDVTSEILHRDIEETVHFNMLATIDNRYYSIRLKYKSLCNTPIVCWNRMIYVIPTFRNVKKRRLIKINRGSHEESDEHSVGCSSTTDELHQVSEPSNMDSSTSSIESIWELQQDRISVAIEENTHTNTAELNQGFEN